MALAFSRILVPVDDSSASAAAVDFALRVARDYDAQLIFANSVDHSAAVAECATAYGFNPGPLIDEMDAQSDMLLKSLLRRSKDARVSASTATLEGSPVPAIVHAAAGYSADAVIIGTHGNQGLRRFALGSTAEGVLRVADVPTFVVRSTEDTTARANSEAPVFGKILVALDDSALSDAAVSFALDVAERKNSTLSFLHVVFSRDALERAAEYGYDPATITQELHESGMSIVNHAKERATERGLQSEAIVMEGEPPECVIRATKTRHSDLLVMGTHGRRGLRRLFLGSVAEQTIRESCVPVAAIRQYRPSATAVSAAPRALGVN